MAEEKKLDEAAKNGKDKQSDTYVCITKCYWNGALYNVGDVVTVTNGEELPEHFKKKQ